ncbi:MAG: hypothetical protein COB07_02030 [Sulfurovum sp.]|nr:MAG: hypothetical protein COB07_02030 [Sulfurovum sp.]
MIAYRHYIKFIPELKNDKKVEGSFVNSIIIKESKYLELADTVQNKIEFPESQGRELALYSDGEFNHNQKEQTWAFEIKGILTFFWHSGTYEIEYIAHESFTEYLLKYWLLHVVLPTFFTIEGIYDFLHAGAVEVGGKPILFIAESFGGKSTMTDYFMKQGHTMISDDKVATLRKEDGIFAVPSYPYHRPYRNMEDMGFFVEQFTHTPKVMQTIYALEGVASDQEVSIEKLSGIENFKALRQAKEMNLFFPESVQMKYLTDILQFVSIFKITVPWDLERLSEVYDAIIQHQTDLEGKNE